LVALAAFSYHLHNDNKNMLQAPLCGKRQLAADARNTPSTPKEQPPEEIPAAETDNL
jgi:hypothetical protein